MNTGDLNFLWSQALIQGLVASGVSDAVISPGARSTPLTLAALREPGLTCHVVVDERCAAFFALGLAKASRRPPLVIATSGSAPAHWHPALLEAGAGGHPMLFISADRPPELHGCGANQTLDQQHLFGRHVRAFHDPGLPTADFLPDTLHALAARLVSQSGWPEPGPVHLNQPFRDPLVPIKEHPLPLPVAPRRVSPGRLNPSPEAVEALRAAISGQPGLILCGEAAPSPGLAEAVTALAETLDCPIVAEPLSNLRFGSHDQHRILTRHDDWLRHPDFLTHHRPQWLLRFGPYPVTRQLQALANSASVATFVVEPLPRWNDPEAALSHLVHADPELTCRALLAGPLQAAPAGWMAAFAAQENLALSATPESALFPAILEALPENCPVFVGNSLVIRQLDRHGGKGAKNLHFLGNRGLSGIDGNLSTTLGVAAAHPQQRAVALVGDLTCLHDAGALALAARHTVAVLVFNNHGGGIFDHLPQANLPEFATGWKTPQAVDFRHLAAAFGVDYAQARDVDGVREALQAWQLSGRSRVIEIPVN